MKTTAFILTAITATAICGCAPKQAKSLVLYYSVSGTTETVAKVFAEKTGADIVRIEAVNPYVNDYQTIIDTYQKEMAEGITRDIQPLEVNLDDYDVIYLGCPVWFGHCAGPMETFLKNYNLAGKKVVPFFTFGSGGNTAYDMVKNYQPEAEIPGWYGVRAARVDKAGAEVEAFLVGIGELEGEAVELPEFSEAREVSEADMAVFNEACGSYPMPLGTPASVCSRELSDAVEYIFTTQNTTPDGAVSTSEIYVTAPKAEGAAAEFTQVVR